MNHNLRWQLVGSVLWVLILAQVSLLTLSRRPMPEDKLFHDQPIAALVTIFLLLMSVFHMITVRWLLLPQMARVGKTTAQQASIIGLILAVAPSIFGIMVVVFTGQTALTLPFSALALVSISLVYSYLKRYAGGRSS